MYYYYDFNEDGDNNFKKISYMKKDNQNKCDKDDECDITANKKTYTMMLIALV